MTTLMRRRRSSSNGGHGWQSGTGQVQFTGASFDRPLLSSS